MLEQRSALRIRVPAEGLPPLLALTGKRLDVEGHPLRLGAPRVQALIPAARLAARLVLIKIAHANEHGVTADTFLEAARRQLETLGIAAEAGIPLVRGGPHAGEPRRRVMKVKNQTHVGFGTIVEGLNAEESIRLQEVGIGGRRLMGCGLFGPAGES